MLSERFPNSMGTREKERRKFGILTDDRLRNRVNVCSWKTQNCSVEVFIHVSLLEREKIRGACIRDENYLKCISREDSTLVVVFTH